METNTIWEATASYHHTYPKLQSEIETDVVIIGGGFTGVSTSYHLQERNVNSVVLEQHTIGWGASGRNGGMMNTGYKLSASQLINKFGIEEAKRLDKYALACNEAVKEISEKHQIDSGVKQCGHIGLARKESKLTSFEKNQELIGKYFNRDIKVLKGADIQTEMQSDYFKAAYYDPLSYHFHPLNYVRGLSEVAASLGANIFEQTKAMNIRKENKQFIVTTPEGKVKANHLIYATDGYSNKIVKELHKGVFPLASYIIATEPLAEDTVNALIPNDRNLYDTINLTNYFRRTPDNRIIFGGSGIGYPAKPKYKTELIKLLTNVYPQLKNINIDYFWGGIIGATVEKFPVIGQTEAGAYYAVGYTGHGAAQSTLHGKLLAQIIVDEARVSPVFEQTPLKTVPLYQQKDLLVSAANLFFRFMDKLN